MEREWPQESRESWRSLLAVVFFENLGFRFSGSHHHLVYKRGEVWGVCYFVRMRITIVVGRWNASIFAGKLGYFIEVFFISLCGGFFVDVVHSVFSRVYFLFRCWAPLGVCWLLFSCDPLCLPRNFGFCFCFLVGLFG